MLQICQKEHLVYIFLAHRVLHKQFDSLVDVDDRVDVEHSAFNCVYVFVIKDEIFNVGLLGQCALLSGESAFLAEVEEVNFLDC